MTAQPPQPLNYYAGTDRPPSRFRLMLGAIPFIAGLGVGAIAAVNVLELEPAFIKVYLQPIVLLHLTFAFALVCVVAYVVAALFFIALFAGQRVERRSWWVCGWVGVAWATMVVAVLPVFIALGAAGSAWGWRLYDFLSLPTVAGGGMAALLVPLFLFRVRSAASPFHQKRSIYVALLTLTPLALELLAVTIGGQIRVQALNRDCTAAAAWVKATHPLPGNYPTLTLPASRRWDYFPKTIDAVICADSRVILLVRPVGWGRGNFFGFVYSTGPITSSELAADAYGRPMILPLSEISVHHIDQQVDNQHFIVSDDLE